LTNTSASTAEVLEPAVRTLISPLAHTEAMSAVRAAWPATLTVGWRHDSEPEADVLNIFDQGRSKRVNRESAA
jgi:hypothetical protein